MKDSCDTENGVNPIRLGSNPVFNDEVATLLRQQLEWWQQNSVPEAME